MSKVAIILAEMAKKVSTMCIVFAAIGLVNCHLHQMQVPDEEKAIKLGQVSTKLFLFYHSSIFVSVFLAITSFIYNVAC